MTHETNPGAVEVTQADKEFAESISYMLEYPSMDIPKIAEKAARHRLAAQPAATVQEVRLTEALKDARAGFEAVQVLLSAMANGRPSIMVETFIERIDAALAAEPAAQPDMGSGEAKRLLDGWNNAESRLGDAEALNRLLSEQLDAANRQIAALSPPEEIGLHVMENYEAIRTALFTPATTTTERGRGNG